MTTPPREANIVRIRLGDEEPATPLPGLRRTLIGYRDGLSTAELWERGRGIWALDRVRVESVDLAVITEKVTNRVVMVGTVDGTAFYPEGKRAIIGTPLPDHPLIGQPDPLPSTSRNSIKYGTVITEPAPPLGQALRPYDVVLADAIAVLTEAARMRRQVLRPTDPTNPRATWEVDPDRTEPADWAELVTLALAGAAANLGGIETALAGRPGSWEADGVRRLLESTVGPDENDLWSHRTEPLTITLYVEDLVSERTEMWRGYDEAEREVRTILEQAEAANPETPLEPYMWTYHRVDDSDGHFRGRWKPDDPAAPAWTIDAWREAGLWPGADDESKAFFERLLLGQEEPRGMLGDRTWLPKTPDLGAEYDRLEQEREDRLPGDLEGQLEDQRTREVAEYGQALKERVEAAARALPGLNVPVTVDVDLTWSSSLDRMSELPDVVERIVEQAIMDTPAPDDLPGTPLSRLLDAQ